MIHSLGYRGKAAVHNLNLRSGSLRTFESPVGFDTDLTPESAAHVLLSHHAGHGTSRFVSLSARATTD